MENYFLEKHPESDLLIISFTGFGGGLMSSPHDFFSTTLLMGCNRILIKDPSRRLCLGGIGGESNSLERLRERLQKDMEEIGARRTFCIGTSGGGFPAILFGHLLQVQTVYAFSPITMAGIRQGFRLGNWKRLLRYIRRYSYQIINMYRLPPRVWRYFYLKKILQHHNGVTRYQIFVGNEVREDILMAIELEELPGVTITSLPCASHNVVKHLIRTRQLFELFEEDLANG